ncbi:S8 family serine peptidase [bacterium LRH843]|nr:S8 family serine peptidase [bacterium LRH843]
MLKRWQWMLVAMLIVFTFTGQAAQANEYARYIIGFNEEIRDEVIKPYSERIYQWLEDIHAVAIELSPKEANQLRTNESISYIEKDEPVHVTGQTVDWGVESIGAPSVWQNGLTGKGVKIAVLDTGVSSSHLDLSVEKGKSFVRYTDSYEDDNGHGTHVAGILAARNNDIGMIGVAHEATIYVAKVLDEKGDGYTSDVVKAIEWSLQQGAELINVSMGGNSPSAALEAALTHAYHQGALIVAAAGNVGTVSGAGNTVEYPAAYESVIAVAAVDQYNKRASFSATGPAVEVAAPGVGITSTYLHNRYASVSGTSMAAPHVTGHLALLKQAYPEASNEELRKLLHKQTNHVGEKGRNPLYGFGVIQLPSYLRAEAPAPLPPENMVVRLLGWDENEAQVEITWEAESEGEKAAGYQIYRNGQKLTKSTTTSYIDKVRGGTYTYAVTALSADEKESDKTVITITIKKNEGAETIESFNDIKGDEWFAEAIYELVNKGVIQGYPDRTAKPNETITRGEAAVMMTRALRETPEPYHESYEDIRPQSFAADYIQTMINQGIFQGYEDDSFRPHAPIPRGEVATILNRAFEFTPSKPGHFPDVSPTYFAYYDIAIVAGANIAKGLPNGAYEPKSPVTRAEFAVFLTRALEYEGNK